MKITLSSLDTQWSDKESNLEPCIETFNILRGKGYDIEIFPEMTLKAFIL